MRKLNIYVRAALIMAGLILYVLGPVALADKHREAAEILLFGPLKVLVIAIGLGALYLLILGACESFSGKFHSYDD